MSEAGYYHLEAANIQAPLMLLKFFNYCYKLPLRFDSMINQLATGNVPEFCNYNDIYIKISTSYGHSSLM